LTAVTSGAKSTKRFKRPCKQLGRGFKRSGTASTRTILYEVRTMMMKTINRVLSTEVARRRKGRSTKRRYLVIEPEADLVASFGQGKALYIECQSSNAWAQVFEHATGESTWISTSKERTEDLVRAATLFLASHHGRKRVLGDLLMMQSPAAESVPALHTLFRHVIGLVSTYTMLPLNELVEILLAPDEESRDLFIGGSYDSATATLTLTRGNLEPVLIPLSLFRRSGDATADPNDLAVTDDGHTIRLGRYEASADAILYEVDPDYRRRVNAKRRQEEKGFGPSLRRLRIQRHLTREEFPGVAAKTIARIERGEIEKPHGKTLRVIARTLGVEPDEIETY
jgi:hypothetical protein